MDSDSGWDNTGELMRFLGDLRVPSLRSAGGKDSSIIVKPNSGLADNFYQVISEHMQDEI